MTKSSQTSPLVSPTSVFLPGQKTLWMETVLLKLLALSVFGSFTDGFGPITFAKDYQDRRISDRTDLKGDPIFF